MEQGNTDLGHDGFGVELDPFNGQLAVTKPHQLSLVGMGGGFQTIGQAGFFYNQRMIAHTGKGVVEPGKHAFTIVMDRAGLTVHDPPCPDYLTAKGLTDGLMP